MTEASLSDSTIRKTSRRNKNSICESICPKLKMGWYRIKRKNKSHQLICRISISFSTTAAGPISLGWAAGIIFWWAVPRGLRKPRRSSRLPQLTSRVPSKAPVIRPKKVGIWAVLWIWLSLEACFFKAISWAWIPAWARPTGPRRIQPPKVTTKPTAQGDIVETHLTLTIFSRSTDLGTRASRWHSSTAAWPIWTTLKTWTPRPKPPKVGPKSPKFSGLSRRNPRNCNNKTWSAPISFKNLW